MDRKTLAVHCGPDRDPATGASSIPIYQASTFHQPDIDHPGPYDYARSGNPTRHALESALAELEGAAGAFAFSSGMAAIASTLLLFAPGDHIIAAEDLYGGTYRALTRLFGRWGLEVSFVDLTRPELVEQAVQSNTRAVFAESPSNPLLKITDLAAVAETAKKHGLLSLVDNTFCTPFLQRPLEFGFDVCLYSATKFLNGHSDVLGGAAVVRTPELAEQLRFVQVAFGAALGVQDCWLLLRGLRTLAVRLEAAQATALRLARALADVPGVRRVWYPGLDGHPGRQVHEGQADGPGAVLSFELADAERVRLFLRSVKLPLVGVSLGGVESILSHPATMSHASMPEPERLRRGVTDGLLRLSVGLESFEDLMEDLTRAFARSASGA